MCGNLFQTSVFPEEGGTGYSVWLYTEAYLFFTTPQNCLLLISSDLTICIKQVLMFVVWLLQQLITCTLLIVTTTSDSIGLFGYHVFYDSLPLYSRDKFLQTNSWFSVHWGSISLHNLGCLWTRESSASSSLVLRL